MDLAFFAIEPARAAEVRLTEPYLLIEGCYLVRQASPITGNDQVDREGVRVVVGAGSAYDLFLSRTLVTASIERAPTSPAVVDHFLTHQCDVAAGVRQQLEADAAQVEGLRLLPDRFMTIRQAMALMPERGDAAANYLEAFIAAKKRDGFVTEALARHAIAGASVAP